VCHRGEAEALIGIAAALLKAAPGPVLAKSTSVQVRSVMSGRLRRKAGNCRGTGHDIVLASG
jgi:hypothetical protein